MVGWHAGGWLGLTRATTAMFGAGAVMTAASMLPAPPADVHRVGVLLVAVAAGLAALVPLVMGPRYTIALSHGFAASGSFMIGLIVFLADGTYLSLLYPIFLVWVAQYAAVFLGRRGAVAHVLLGATVHAAVIGVLPADQRAVSWSITFGTALVVVFCYRQFHELSARLRALVERSGGVIAIVDRDLVVTSLRGPVERLLAHEPDAVLRSPLLRLIHPDDHRQVVPVLSRALAEPNVAATFQARMFREDGTCLHVEGSVENALADRAVNGLVVTLRDVTERTELEQQLTHQAFHDPLTGLANRALFADRVEHALVRRNRPGERLAVLFVDLDDFKSVNDSLGHGAGDQLLSVLAHRLATTVREGDTVARLGGDEFAVLVEEMPAVQAVEQLADRLLDVLAMPVPLGAGEVVVGASIGIVVSDDQGTTAADLLRDADTAMYRAKTQGKGRHQRFDRAMHEQLVRRLQLKTDLRYALERQQLYIEYQPTVHLHSGDVHGVEALLRWRHPDFGLVSPAEFIPLAEESDLIVSLGRWVLEQACVEGRRWQDLRPDGPALAISVNVSGRQLQSEGLVDDVRQALRRSGLPPDSLTVEITESVLLADLDAAVARLQRLRQLGVRVAIDDFGTGYSSFSYLNSLPIDVLKVDRSFVTPIGDDPERLLLLESILQVARTLKLPAIAEGIEQDDQAELLRAAHCEYGQGFLFARPMDPAAVTALLGGSPRRTQDSAVDPAA